MRNCRTWAVPTLWMFGFMLPTVFVTTRPCDSAVCLAREPQDAKADPHAKPAEPPKAAPASQPPAAPASKPAAAASAPTSNTTSAPTSAPSSAPASAPSSRPAPFSELPTGEIVADKFDIVFPPGLREISLKLQKILAERQGWWREYSKTYSKAGQPVPYHPNMGVSPEEYDLFLKLSAQVRFEKQSDAVLRITKTPEGAYGIESTDGNLLDITGVQIDFANRRMVTPLGMVTDCVIMAAGDDPDQSRNLGPWEGFRWRLQKGGDDIKNVTFVQCDLGRLTQSDRLYMSFRSQKLENGNVTFKANFTITMPRNK